MCQHPLDQDIEATCQTFACEAMIETLATTATATLAVAFRSPTTLGAILMLRA